LKTIWNKWLNFAHRIGNFNARVILSLFYFIFISPFAIFVKLFLDPLRIKKGKSSYWIEREGEKQDIEVAMRQF